MSRLKDRQCKQCGHSWISRIDNPKKCPGCGSLQWATAAKNLENHYPEPEPGFEKCLQCECVFCFEVGPDKCYNRFTQDDISDAMDLLALGNSASEVSKTIGLDANRIKEYLKKVGIDWVFRESRTDISKRWASIYRKINGLEV